MVKLPAKAVPTASRKLAILSRQELVCCMVSVLPEQSSQPPKSSYRASCSCASWPGRESEETRKHGYQVCWNGSTCRTEDTSRLPTGGSRPRLSSHMTFRRSDRARQQFVRGSCGHPNSVASSRKTLLVMVLWWLWHGSQSG